MNSYGLSILEIKHLIERALLPDKCECTVDGEFVRITLSSHADPSDAVVITGIKKESLNTSRAIAELIGEARYLLVKQIAKRRELHGNGRTEVS